MPSEADDAREPVVVRPDLKRRLWGGDRLPDLLGVDPPPGDDPVGEAWLLHDQARIQGGAWHDRTVADWCDHGGMRLPLWVKLLDAAQELSLQVHPDDAVAARDHADTGYLGKTETWRVLQAQEGATVAWGFRQPVTRQQVHRAALDGSLPRLVRTVPVQPGEVIHNPAGTVHAIGAGLLLYELQQASDLTYRLFDHGRLGADGRPRALHLDQALAVADLSGSGEPRVPARPGADGWTQRVACSAYRLDERDLNGTVTVRGDGSLQVVTIVNGQVRVAWGEGNGADLRHGATLLLPSEMSHVTLQGNALLLRGRTPTSR